MATTKKIASGNHRSVQAWRTIGGKRCFLRSKLEANYCRYLQFLKECGEIKDWEHEPCTFWFDGIRRGVCSYLPDFRVENKDGEISFHETKGYLDAKSKTKLKRMAKYHPDVKMVYIGQKEFSAITRTARKLIRDWE